MIRNEGAEIKHEKCKENNKIKEFITTICKHKNETNKRNLTKPENNNQL